MGVHVARPRDAGAREDVKPLTVRWRGMPMSWAAMSVMFGLGVSVGPALVAYRFPQAAALQQLGAVVLGGLIAMQACRPRH
jgi:hypothetical protein